MPRPRHQPLPLADGPAPERADAARNREVLLAAARQLMLSEGICAVSMDRVARLAGVGIGTVYRRFTDRCGLALALLGDSERQFQAAFLTGPPPLGPGAAPETRIRAFLHCYIDRLETDAELHAIAETSSPTGRYNNGAYRTARTHLSWLLTEAGAQDPAYHADALLTLLSAGLFQHHRHELHLSPERIKAGLDSLVTGLLSQGTPSPN